MMTLETVAKLYSLVAYGNVVPQVCLRLRAGSALTRLIIYGVHHT